MIPTGNKPVATSDQLFLKRRQSKVRHLVFVSFYRRRLPHWQPRDKAVFVTWRLHRSCEHRRFLDRPEIAKLVEDSLRFGATVKDWYWLHSYAIMPNHVHVLLDTDKDLARITHRIKRFTARRANQILARTGNPFWQIESFDHWLRTEWEFRETVEYIEMNPVRSGLSGRPEEYRWSSAWMGHSDTLLSKTNSR